MSAETTRSSVEFTADAERLIAERARAFAEQLRFAAIDEAIRRRGSADEVTASDVARATSLEQAPLAAYSEKLDSVMRLLSEQFERTYMMNRENSERLRSEFARLMDSVGRSKLDQDKIKELYSRIQEQSYATNIGLREEVARQLESLRASLAERPQAGKLRRNFFDRVLLLYTVAGAMAAFAGLSATWLKTILQNPTGHLWQYMTLTGFLISIVSGFSLWYRHLTESSYRDIDRDRDLYNYYRYLSRK